MPKGYPVFFFVKIFFQNEGNVVIIKKKCIFVACK